MAGTLVIDTLKSSTTGAPTFQNTSGTEIGQLCKAWVNFNGVTTATIRASFNVSSVTRNSTGDYTVNFTNALADANYSITAGGGAGAFDAVSYVTAAPSTTAPTTTSFRMLTYQSHTLTKVDMPNVNVAVFR